MTRELLKQGDNISKLVKIFRGTEQASNSLWCSVIFFLILKELFRPCLNQIKHGWKDLSKQVKGPKNVTNKYNYGHEWKPYIYVPSNPMFLILK